MKWTPIVAMLCIAGLAAVALIRGEYGAVVGIVVCALAGLGGYELKRRVEKKKKE